MVELRESLEMWSCESEMARSMRASCGVISFFLSREALSVICVRAIDAVIDRRPGKVDPTTEKRCRCASTTPVASEAVGML